MSAFWGLCSCCKLGKVQAGCNGKHGGHGNHVYTKVKFGVTEATGVTEMKQRDLYDEDLKQ